MTDSTNTAKPLNTAVVETRPGWFEQYATPEAAAKRIMTLSNGRKVFLRVGQEARIADDDSRYFPVSGNVAVGRAVAIAYVQDAYKGFADRGAMVQLVWCETCLFVG
jgi:hypothetical protein